MSNPIRVSLTKMSMNHLIHVLQAHLKLPLFRKYLLLLSMNYLELNGCWMISLKCKRIPRITKFKWDSSPHWSVTSFGMTDPQNSCVRWNSFCKLFLQTILSTVSELIELCRQWRCILQLFQEWKHSSYWDEGSNCCKSDILCCASA